MEAPAPDVLAAATAVGEGAVEEPGVLARELAALLGTAVAPAASLEVEEDDAPTGLLQTSRLPVTGRRPSMSPVNVAITVFG